MLNNPRYKGAEILIAGKNFGCGSSREHAAWALTDFGFRAVIAPTFADIFFSNAGKNGIVLARLSEERSRRALEERADGSRLQAHRLARRADRDRRPRLQGTFDIDPFRKYCLLKASTTSA